MKKIILLIILSLFFWQSYWFNQINLKQYQTLTNILSWKKLNQTKLNKILQTPLSACNHWLNWKYYFISPRCFLSWNKLPKIDFKTTIDDILPFISDFKNVYNLNSTEFYYTTAQPQFYINYNIDNIIKQNQNNKIILHILWLLNYYIKIPKIYFEFKQAKKYSFYVSTKDLTLRNKWRLQNFNIAMNQLDWYLLKWWKTLTLNNLIANKPWYDTNWIKKWKYLFYGGVCGVSTMLFRNALINPYLYVEKRYNHAQRYVNFYSKYIYGDDSSMYEYHKILNIKNISNYPIYFKKKQIWENLYFMSIIPKKSNSFTWISKKQIKKLTAQLINKTINNNWKLLYTQSWISNYKRKNYER